MNLLRRIQVGAGVVLGTAALGAGVGVVVASALLTTRIGHIRPQLLGELWSLGTQTGAAFGVLVGTPLTFALLRRVPLGRIARDVVVAATYGGILGYALSMPFAEPRPSIALMLAVSCLGVGLAAARLWARFRPVAADDRLHSAV